MKKIKSHDEFVGEAKKVTPGQVSKQYEIVAKISKDLLANLADYKAAKESGNEDDIAKYTKIAGELSAKKREAESKMNKLISMLDADTQLMYNESTNIEEAVELVHVYKNGELFGTGTVKKTKGKKSLVSFDAENEEWFDNKDVKVVESEEVNEAKSWKAIEKLIQKAGKTADATADYVKDYTKSLERMFKRDSKEFFATYGDNDVDDFIEDIEYNLRNESVVNEATVVVDAIDPKSKGLAKLLKRNNVKLEILGKGPNGYTEVSLAGKRKDLVIVLSDDEYGWDDEDLADYIEESKVNEKRTIQTKRRYTESHPARTVGKTAKIRNKILEAIKDGRMTQTEFDKLVKELSSDHKRWMKRNSQLFNVSEEGISLSKFGKKILKGITVNENVVNESFEAFVSSLNENSEALIALKDDIEGAEIYTAYSDGRSVQAQRTKKTWDDGSPVLKDIARSSKKSVKLPKEFDIVEDETYGWWYFYNKKDGYWYGIDKDKYSTPPFEY